jgi:hypothetical protein
MLRLVNVAITGTPVKIAISGSNTFRCGAQHAPKDENRYIDYYAMHGLYKVHVRCAHSATILAWFPISTDS